MKNQSLISGRWPLLSLISICPSFHKISELFFLLAELSPQQKIWTTVCILQSDVWLRALPFYTAAQWWSTISTVAESYSGWMHCLNLSFLSSRVSKLQGWRLRCPWGICSSVSETTRCFYISAWTSQTSIFGYGRSFLVLSISLACKKFLTPNADEEKQET